MTVWEAHGRRSVTRRPLGLGWFIALPGSTVVALMGRRSGQPWPIFRTFPLRHRPKRWRARLRARGWKPSLIRKIAKQPPMGAWLALGLLGLDPLGDIKGGRRIRWGANWGKDQMRLPRLDSPHRAADAIDINVGPDADPDAVDALRYAMQAIPAGKEGGSGA